MGFSCFNHVKITGITGVVPEKIINIDDEIQYYDNDVKKLERNKKILGLGTRHVVEDGVTTVDLCEKAAKNLICESSIEANSIDALFVISNSHDYSYPASSCILQGRLGLPQSCACFDLSGIGCSAYVYGLWLAHTMIESGAIKRCILCVGDTPSKDHTNINNRNTSILFGDGAVATLIERSSDISKSYFLLGTEGDKWDKIIAPAGGSRLPIKDDIINLDIRDQFGNVWYMWEAVMKGLDVYEFTCKIGPWGINEILKYSNMCLSEIDSFVFHQANKQIVSAIASRVGIDKEKYSCDTFSKYGNCSSASVATNICDFLCGKCIKYSLLSTFGVGLSYGFCIVDLSEMKNGGIDFLPMDNILSRQELIEHWINYYKGEC